MRKYALILTVLLLSACGNNVSGTLVAFGPCDDAGCYAELGNNRVFIPDAVDPDGRVFDEGKFKVAVEKGMIDGEEILIVKKVISKKDL